MCIVTFTNKMKMSCTYHVQFIVPDALRRYFACIAACYGMSLN